MPYSSRLNPTQLNNLNLSYIEGVLVKNEDYTIDEGFNHERIKKISNDETWRARSAVEEPLIGVR